MRESEAKKNSYLKHITDEELVERANISNDEWITIEPGLSPVDYYLSQKEQKKQGKIKF